MGYYMGSATNDILRGGRCRSPSGMEGGGMADKQILCGFGVDLDAVGGWLGSYGGEDSPDDISRGLFAGEVGTPRLLKLFERLGHQDQLVHPRPLH